MEVIKVSANSRTSAVAGAIAGMMRDQKHVEVQTIGAGALNQAVKAIIVAKSYLHEDGIEIAFTPVFVDIEIEDKTRTGIKFIIDPRQEQASMNG